MAKIQKKNRVEGLRKIAMVLLVVLLGKVLVTILYEYRWYFPPDFDSSAFLAGRRPQFHGVYQAAFYVHIVSSPMALVFGAILMISGGRARVQTFHWLLGRAQFLIVMTMVVPSGLVMATRAVTGPIAGWGFAMLAIATASCMWMAVRHAKNRQFALHQRWATRVVILLCSPLLLRLGSGLFVVLQIDADWTYQATAWLSWLVPLAIYEAWSRRRSPIRLAIPRQGARLTTEG